MACAGSASGSRSPHGHPRGLPGYCQAAPDLNYNIDDVEYVAPKRKGRGTAKGHEIQRVRAQLGGAKIPLIWDPRHRTSKVVSKYYRLYNTGVGIYVRTRCEPFHHFWRDVSSQHKKQIFEDVKEHFHPVYPDVVDRDVADAYSEWKATINKNIKMLGGKALTAPRPENVMTDEHWHECLKRAASEEFQEISKINTDNRKNLKYPSLQGRTPYPRRRYEDVDPVTDPVGKSVFAVWRDAHMKEGKWVDDEAELDYDIMLEMVHGAAPDGHTTPEQEQHIMETILGRRRSHISGIGPAPPTRRITGSSNESTYMVTREEYDRLQREQTEKYDQLERKHQEVINTMSVMLRYMKERDPHARLPDVGQSSAPDVGQSSAQSSASCLDRADHDSGKR